MRFRNPILACALLFLLTGCPEARFYTNRTVALNFPASAGQIKVSLSVSDTQVQEALRLIDTVLTADGLTRDPNPPATNDQGFVASYTRYNGTGPRRLDEPSVYLKDGQLLVVVLEWGNRTGHPNEATRRICNLLKTELSRHYGAGRVKIER